MSIEATQRPLVAVGVIVLKEGKILLGERIASHGAGTFQIPGGHMEFGKTFEEQALAEVAEETGLTDIVLDRLVSINNERIYGKQYVNIGFLASWRSGEPTSPEPEKSRNWKWYDPNNLPEPLFASSLGIINAWKSGTLVNEIKT